MPGASIRTDIVEVYAFSVQALSENDRSVCPEVSFLQLRRSKGQMSGSWQPVMGHVEENETSTDAALRELKEETGYAPNHGLIRLWQLESVNTYFLATDDSVMMSPGFAALVVPNIAPRLDDAHDGFRWVKRDHADRLFIWPGQRTAIDQIVRDIVPTVASGDAAKQLGPDTNTSIEEALRVKLKDQ